ncbi:type II toxin-antitoxin system RelE/ParE family toxin [Taibaiella koreensis]|uniref:type II toxin-antitoxin system RelE/ParE family toxin n=1 Tax=Taibaiella koreensis TaxID=1268548 RepID=UPI0037426D76
MPVKSFIHKGLKVFYTTGNGSRLPAEQRNKINRILDMLDAVTCIADIEHLGMGIHRLTGNRSGGMEPCGHRQLPDHLYMGPSRYFRR